MKNIVLLFAFLFVSQLGLAQIDTIIVTQPSTTTSTNTSTKVISTTSSSSSDFRSVRLGIRFAPGLSFNSSDGKNNLRSVNNDGTEARLSGGLNADFFFAENYAFSTGLWYTIRRSAFTNLPAGPAGQTALSGKSEYNLQYLQFPVALKLYTNEVSTDMRVYFQLGGTFDVKLAEKEKDRDSNYLWMSSESQNKNVYKPVDVSLLLGSGIELQMGENTTFFGGLTYNRGLINVMNSNLKDNNDEGYSKNLKSLNSLLSLEIGLKF